MHIESKKMFSGEKKGANCERPFPFLQKIVFYIKNAISSLIVLIFEANKETPSWFSMMRWYLVHWPDEVPRTFRMLDLIAHGADGHGPVHLLRVSAAEFGFAWEGKRGGGFGLPFSPFGCWLGSFSNFRALSSRPGSSKLVLNFRIGRDSRALSSWISKDLYNNPPLPT